MKRRLVFDEDEMDEPPLHLARMRAMRHCVGRSHGSIRRSGDTMKVFCGLISIWVFEAAESRCLWERTGEAREGRRF